MNEDSHLESDYEDRTFVLEEFEDEEDEDEEDDE